MQSIFAIKDTIGKKETREISALCGVTVTQVWPLHLLFLESAFVFLTTTPFFGIFPRNWVTFLLKILYYLLCQLIIMFLPTVHAVFCQFWSLYFFRFMILASYLDHILTFIQLILLLLCCLRLSLVSIMIS